MMFVVYVRGRIVRMSMRQSDEKAELDTLPLSTSQLSCELYGGQGVSVHGNGTSTRVGLIIRGRARPTALPLTFYTMPTEGEIGATQAISRSGDAFAGMVIMERSRHGRTRPAMQVACPARGLFALLESIKHLCEKFVEVYGYLPAEVSLHLLIRLELMLCGYTCIYGMLGEGSEGHEGRMMKIPFVFHCSTKRKGMLIVRGEK